jgi:hypothetical protein
LSYAGAGRSFWVGRYSYGCGRSPHCFGHSGLQYHQNTHPTSRPHTIPMSNARLLAIA